MEHIYPFWIKVKGNNQSVPQSRWMHCSHQYKALDVKNALQLLHKNTELCYKLPFLWKTGLELTLMIS